MKISSDSGWEAELLEAIFMKYIHSKNYDKSRLLEVLSLDDCVYDKKLTGTFESVSGRYKTNEEMFIFAVDDED